MWAAFCTAHVRVALGAVKVNTNAALLAARLGGGGRGLRRSGGRSAGPGHLDVCEVDDAHVAIHTHAHVPSAAAGAGFGERADRAGQGAGEAGGPRSIVVARLDHVGAEAGNWKQGNVSITWVPDLDGRNGMLRAEVEFEPRSLVFGVAN